MKDSSLQRDTLQAEYSRRFEEIFVRLAPALCEHIADYMKDQPRIDRITVRPKSVERFLKKAATTEGVGLKYSEPLAQIQDQVGARIVVFYNQDVEQIDKIVKKYFTAIEYRNLVPESEAEFGYFGHHLVLVLPSEIIEEDMDRSMIPRFFELQIKTLFQHAWSEADHDLGYKPEGTALTPDQKRRIAFTSAQAWGADLIFDQLFQERSI